MGEARITRSRIEPFGVVAEPEIGKGDVRFFVGHHVGVRSQSPFGIRVAPLHCRETQRRLLPAL